MSQALARKLSLFLQLKPEDHSYLAGICNERQAVGPHKDIVCEGDVPSSMFVLEEGIAVRYRVMSNGQRQILGFMLPGDLCDLNVFLLRSMDHSVAALNEVRISRIRRKDVLATYFERPRIAAALWWSALQAESIARERIVALGKRQARGRIAYLFFDIYWRMRSIGLAKDDLLLLPLTQVEIADTLGLTPVHVNRVLKTLTDDGLIRKTRESVKLLDPAALQREADMDDHYLHLDAPPEDIGDYFDNLQAITGRTIPPGSRDEIKQSA